MEATVIEAGRDVSPQMKAVYKAALENGYTERQALASANAVVVMLLKEKAGEVPTTRDYLETVEMYATNFHAMPNKTFKALLKKCSVA